MTTGAICSDECEMLARYTEAYVASVRARLLPAISGLEPWVRDRMENAYTAVISATKHGDGESDVDLALSAASDVEQEAVDDLLFVQEQILNLAVAGLFHFWERSMRRVLLRAIRFRLPVSERKVIENANALELSKFFHASGKRPPSCALLEQLRELALIANVVKHGAGRSLGELAKQFPERVDGDSPEMAIAETVRITEDDLDKFGDVVARFWRSISASSPMQLALTAEPIE